MAPSCQGLFIVSTTASSVQALSRRPRFWRAQPRKVYSVAETTPHQMLRRFAPQHDRRMKRLCSSRWQLKPLNWHQLGGAVHG